MVVHVINTREEYDDALEAAGDKLVIVDFFAVWCGPCKMMESVIAALSEANSDVVFLKVDVDNFQDLTLENDISSIPTFLFFKNGQKVDEVNGANKSKIMEVIEQNK